MNNSFIDSNISIKRFQSYDNEEEYRCNIKLSSEIYSLLSIFEVSLRNRVFIYFKKQYNVDDELVFEKIYGNFKNRINGHTKDIINNDSLTVHQKISKLNLGFWVSLFSYIDEQNLTLRNNYIPIKEVFSKEISFQSLGQICDISIIRKIRIYQPQYNIEARYMAIKLLQSIRNRAFHYENLFKKNKNNFPRISHKIYLISEKTTTRLPIIGVQGSNIVRFLKFVNKCLDKRLAEELYEPQK